jgi:hypothetical protein
MRVEATSDNFTPRLGKDTSAAPGQPPGLSAWDAIPPGKKAQGIETTKLLVPLAAIADDITQGGNAGHFLIVPTNERREVDVAQLQDWAMSRGTGQIHPLTQILLNAVVHPNVKGATP